MSTGLPLASGKSEIFEVVLQFMPDWVQITVLVLVVLAVLASWGVKLKRKIARRGTARAGRPAHTAAQHGQGRGADHLGPYAPQQQARQPSGADFLGAYAPARTQAAQPDAQGSGADHLGSYAPQQQPGNGPA
ncbi:hypothetical protein [Streptomyces bicolor]|uniref:hypothetical protein n=1 Tax=Streptomyces bicolor TaxID=66874 RepID=UPI0004E11228|nr:hypothetical protein [Streptomyces bicolor]